MARTLSLALVVAASACASAGSSPFDAGVSGASTSGTFSAAKGTATGSGTGIIIDLGGDSGPAGSSTSSSTTSTSLQASSGAGSPDATVSDAGGSSRSGSASGSSTSSAAGSATGSGSGAGDSGACFKPPSKIYKETTPGVYCPFSGSGGGSNVTCAAGEHCCEPPESAGTVSTCEGASTSCPVEDSTDWGCEGAPDCAAHAGTTCCGTGTIETQPAQPTCGDGGTSAFPYVSEFTGTSCQTTCATYQVCSQDSECPGGAAGSCVAIEPKGNPVGYCK